jgi:hypothetical protein
MLAVVTHKPTLNLTWRTVDRPVIDTNLKAAVVVAKGIHIAILHVVGEKDYNTQHDNKGNIAEAWPKAESGCKGLEEALLVGPRQL